jgi:hypothetical protein
MTLAKSKSNESQKRQKAFVFNKKNAKFQSKLIHNQKGTYYANDKGSSSNSHGKKIWFK